MRLLFTDQSEYYAVCETCYERYKGMQWSGTTDGGPRWRTRAARFLFQHGAEDGRCQFCDPEIGNGGWHENGPIVEGDPDLGECCVCRQAGHTVRNIVMLGFKAPVPGTGWGCAVCGLPANGALAVVCDRCAGRFDRVTLYDVCYDYPATKKRKAYASFFRNGITDRRYRVPLEPFHHDMSKHPKEDQER